MTTPNRANSAAPQHLRCEYLENPVGLEETKPRLSWQIADSRRGARQTAFQILVASSAEKLAADKGDLWDSRRVRSNENIHIDYRGRPLKSRQRCFWKVRAWDRADVPSQWSEAACWEMGLLLPKDWSAQWIGLSDATVPTPVVTVRKPFSIDHRVRRARVYVTALGVYELRLNGARVGDQLFAPGWTHYRKRVIYQTYDVTAQLRAGENVIGAFVGEGWCLGDLGWDPPRRVFGDPPARLLAQLEIEFEDGSSERIVTDGSWTATSDGPIRASSIYHGENYDARLAMPGWDAPGYAATDWKAVEVFADPKIERNAQHDPPIRVTQELRPVSVAEQKPGVFIFDMGQNMVGFCRLRARGTAGTQIQLRHAEVLNKDGSIYVENLRNAKATDTLILRGTGEVEEFTPHFTYHGFRYVEVTGFPGRPALDALTGLVFHTDCKSSATFETSSKLVNQLWRNITWGQRGNMHSVLTDCPQRNERLGWMGDAQVFARTACFNMDMAAMLTKFVRDMRDSQLPDGSFTDICPATPWATKQPGAPAWADAGVILPWIVRCVYDDRRLLERHFEAMKRQVDFVAAHNPVGIWATARGNDYGDWVPAGSKTDKAQFATLNWFHSTNILAETARLLGRRDDARKYAALAAKIKAAFNRLYFVNGHYLNTTQTVNAMALELGIAPEKHRAAIALDLVADIRKRGWHLSTGFSGTQMLLPALSEAGYHDVACRLLLNRDYPSWGYTIKKGATTIWELWNSDTEGPSMNSRNHFAFGSVGEWLFRYLAGIDLAPNSTGYKHVLIHPHPSRPAGELRWVKAAYDSIQGRIASEWKVEPSAFTLSVEIPANTKATVVIPADTVAKVTESGNPLRQAAVVTKVRTAKGNVICEIGAGRYDFRSESRLFKV